ncbi:MAG: hypothetical protein HZR80_01690 [Candidatus Heimdallarchaeota archaeon]
MKIKITSIGDQWLLSKEDNGSYKKAGKIKPMLNNSAIFLFENTQAQITVRELENVVNYKLSADNIALKSTLSQIKSTNMLTWKSVEDTIDELKCFSKSSHHYILYKKNKIAKMKRISDNTFIFEMTSSTSYNPIVLLASLYPLF